jgi:hypothetical protein
VRVIAVLVLVSAAALPSRAAASEAPASQPFVADQGALDAGLVAGHKARVTFETPGGFTALSVWFDDVRVPIATMSTNAFTVEAGDHVVDAKAMRGGRDFAYQARIHLTPGDFQIISLTLREISAVSACGTPAVCACVTSTRTEEEVQKCVTAQTPPPAESCRACLISAAAPPPWSLLIIPLVALARRRKRSTRGPTR